MKTFQYLGAILGFACQEKNEASLPEICLRTTDDIRRSAKHMVHFPEFAGAHIIYEIRFEDELYTMAAVIPEKDFWRVTKRLYEEGAYYIGAAHPQIEIAS